MQHFVLVKMYNSKATAQYFTKEELLKAGYEAGYHKDGDPRKNTPDIYVDGFKTLVEAKQYIRDVRTGNY